MQLPQVYILVLNYLRWEDTRDCLDSLLRSTYSRYHILVADNASGNGSVESLTRWLGNRNRQMVLEGGEAVNWRVHDEQDEAAIPEPEPGCRITFIHNEKNNGFAAGNNRMLRLIAGKEAWVWLLNPDMTVNADTLGNLVDFAESNPRNSVTGTTVMSWQDNHKLLFYGGGKVNYYSATVRMARRESEIPGLDYISGASLFTHNSVYKETGLLPEDYFLYWEETDWCRHARNKGISLRVCKEAVCYDKISTVIGRSFLADYYYVRNGLYFISAYRKKNLPPALLMAAIRVLKRLVTGQWKRARGVAAGVADFLKKKKHAY